MVSWALEQGLECVGLVEVPRYDESSMPVMVTVDATIPGAECMRAEFIRRRDVTAQSRQDNVQKLFQTRCAWGALLKNRRRCKS